MEVLCQYHRINLLRIGCKSGLVAVKLLLLASLIHIVNGSTELTRTHIRINLIGNRLRQDDGTEPGEEWLREIHRPFED
jgi:hypothetical protein